MNGLGASQLDVFLEFSEMFLLIFSPKWRLVDLHPGHRSFLGWNESNLSTFLFQRDFLEPNSLDLSGLLGGFQGKDHAIKNLFFRDEQGRVEGPFRTFLRLKKDEGQIRSLMVFIQYPGEEKFIKIPPQAKYKQFIGEFIPGLIHNINGPLGTINGRLELLNYKYPQIKELDELLKMSFKIQSLLENLSYKIINEKYFQPVEINLNRLLREEVRFFTSDLFFKHQVELQERYANNIPQFRMIYFSITGVLDECYLFFRKFVFENSEYYFQIESSYEDERAAIDMKMMGDFHTPEDVNLRFPIQIKGDATTIARNQMEGIDLPFLAFCLEQNKGYLEINARKEIMTMHLEFPVVKSYL